MQSRRCLAVNISIRVYGPEFHSRKAREEVGMLRPDRIFANPHKTKKRARKPAFHARIAGGSLRQSDSKKPLLLGAARRTAAGGESQGGKAKAHQSQRAGLGYRGGDQRFDVGIDAEIR